MATVAEWERRKWKIVTDDHGYICAKRGTKCYPLLYLDGFEDLIEQRIGQRVYITGIIAEWTAGRLHLIVLDFDDDDSNPHTSGNTHG